MATGGARSTAVRRHRAAKAKQDYVCARSRHFVGRVLDTNDRNAAHCRQRAIVWTDITPRVDLLIDNSTGTGGTAWIYDVQIIDPAGRFSRIVSHPTIMDEYTAWYNQAYGEVFGGGTCCSYTLGEVRRHRFCGNKL